MPQSISRDMALIIIFAITILGPSCIIAAASFAGISAIGRNPSAAPKIFTILILILVFSTAISIIALLVLFQVYAP